MQPTRAQVERLPQLRPANTAYNGRWKVPTFDEVLKLAASSRTCSGKRVGVIPEIKHSTFFAQQGFDLEPKVVKLLNAYGYGGHRDPAVIQSFEVGNLKRLSRMNRRMNKKPVAASSRMLSGPRVHSPIEMQSVLWASRAPTAVRAVPPSRMYRVRRGRGLSSQRFFLAR